MRYTLGIKKYRKEKGNRVTWLWIIPYGMPMITSRSNWSRKPHLCWNIRHEKPYCQINLERNGRDLSYFAYSQVRRCWKYECVKAVKGQNHRARDKVEVGVSCEIILRLADAKMFPADAIMQAGLHAATYRLLRARIGFDISKFVRVLWF